MKKEKEISADRLHHYSRRFCQLMYDGYLLFCNKTSQQQCLSRKRYTCADKKNMPTAKIKEGSILFLYNVDDKSLLGPFTALTEGGDELDAGAWAMDVDTHIPSEDLKVTWEDLHIIQNAPAELPFLEDSKTCKLSSTQTQRVLDLLKQGQLYLYAKNQSTQV
jgi:hypothetical protein